MPCSAFPFKAYNLVEATRRLEETVKLPVKADLNSGPPENDVDTRALGTQTQVDGL